MHFESLTPGYQAAVRLLQKLDFGEVQLTIRDGEPVMDPHPKVIKTHKLGVDAGPRPECGLSDFLLKKQVRDFIDQTSKMNNCSLKLEVQNGLPFRMRFEVEG